MLPLSLRWIFTILGAFRVVWQIDNSEHLIPLWMRIQSLLRKKEIDTGWLDCKYCIAIRVVIPFAFLALFPTIYGDLFLAWVGLSGAVTLLIRWRSWD